MHEETDDTVPQAVRTVLAFRDDTITVDAIDGDTIMRETRASAAGIALPPVPAALLPRHRVRVGDGEPVELDRPLVIGRRPGVSRVPAQKVPQLIVVASPEGGISASHLEVRQDGHVVTVRDLRTLNGSIVHIPGSRPAALVGGASLTVVAGTVVDLGEGVRVEILAPGAARPGAGAPL